MPAVSTCLWFDSQALEAAEFYVSIVPNSRITSVMRDPGGNPHTTAGQVLYVEFELDGQRFGGLNGGPAFVLDEAASVVLTCASQEEADGLWDRFTAEGRVQSRVYRKSLPGGDVERTAYEVSIMRPAELQEFLD